MKGKKLTNRNDSDRTILPRIPGALCSVLLAAIAGVAVAEDGAERAALGSPASLDDFPARVSPDRIAADVTTLVGFGTRHTLSETDSDVRGIGAARRWLEARFRSISRDCGYCLEVFTVGEVVQGRRIPEPTEVVNVIAVLRGETDPDRYVMMSGDIDSRASDPLDFQTDAPGANDNASGLAGVLEAARILSSHRFPASIVFAGLSGEEQGLYGGRILAEHAVAEGWWLQAVLNNDMIGNIEGSNGVIDNGTARVFSEGTRAVETPEEARVRRFTGGEVDSASRNLARFVDAMADAHIPNLDVLMIYRLDRFGRGGHHRPFNEAGFPAVYDNFTGNLRYNFYHTLDDKGLPDTLYLDPVTKYDLTIHTIPSITRENIELNPKKHNIIELNTPQGYLKISHEGVKLQDNLNDKIKGIIHPDGSKDLLNVQEFDKPVKYLTGAYDIELLTLPWMDFDDITIDQNKTTSIQIPSPGIANIVKKYELYGSIFINQEGRMKKIYHLRSGFPIENIALQPGKYIIVYKPKYATSMHSTLVKEFEIKSGITSTIKL